MAPARSGAANALLKWQGDKHVIHESYLSLADPFEVSLKLTDIEKIEQRIRGENA